MDLPLDSISLPPWDPNRAAEWDEAYEKIENYLRACRVASHLHRARLTALILRRAYERQQAGGADAGRSLAELAVNESRARIAEWVDQYLPAAAAGRVVNPGEGMLALYLSDGPLRWPNAFLDSRQMPAEFADALRARVVRAGPDLAVSSMVPREMDIGLLPEIAGSALGAFESIPLLKTLLAWTLFLGALIYLFWYTR